MESVWGHVRSRGQVLLMLSLMHTGISLGMVVTSTGPQTLKRPQGESVALGCTYSPGPADIGGLDIEWSKVSPDVTQKDQLVLSFTGEEQYQLGPPDLMKRMKFTGNPATGDASILISNLQTSDTSTYQCKVKKTPGIDSRKVTVVVLVRPSVPKCWVEGPEEKGQPVSLRCSSKQGSVPLTYTWSREDGASLPPAASMNVQTGELLIKNHSESFTGRYVCVAKNEVGQETCVYNLHAYTPVNKAGVIAGAVIGALLLLLLLILLILLLICCCCRKRDEKEVAHDIREDVAAPASRPASRVSSMRSIAGYHTHSGVFYSSVRGSVAPQRAPSGNASRHSRHSGHTASPPPDTASVYKPPLTYDSRYGYPV